MTAAPTRPDFFTEYGRAPATSIYNVQADSSVLKGRQGFSGFQISGAAASGAGAQSTAVTINFDEILLFGGPYTLSQTSPWLCHVNKLTWSFVFATQLQKLVSITANAQATNISFVNGVSGGSTNLFSNVNLWLESADPSPFDMIPPTVRYPIDRYDLQQSVTYTVAAGASASMTSPIVAMGSIPSRLYLFPKVPQISFTDATTSDFVGQITGLTLTLDNKVSMTTFDANALAMKSLRNGYRSGFDDDRAVVTCQANITASGATTAYGVVAPGLCLVFGKDIDLPAGVVAGSQGTHTLQCVATVKNQSANSVTMVLDVVLVYDDILEVSHAQAVVSPLNIQPSEATKKGERVAPHLQAHGVAGGGLVYGPLKAGGHSGGGDSGGGRSGGGHSGGGRTGGSKHKLK
jgi:uncharacterized membrane protein YgcG